MEVLHRHHIIPRHAGGTDDESNLFLLTHVQHALAHRNRAILLHSPKDWIAWKMMSGQMGKEEARKSAWKIGYAKRDKSFFQTIEYQEKKRLESLRRGSKPPRHVGKNHPNYGNPNKINIGENNPGIKYRNMTWRKDPITGKRIWENKNASI